MTTTTVKVVGSRDGKAGFLGSIGVRLMIEGPEAGDAGRNCCGSPLEFPLSSQL